MRPEQARTEFKAIKAARSAQQSKSPASEKLETFANSCSRCREEHLVAEQHLLHLLANQPPIFKVLVNSTLVVNPEAILFLGCTEEHEAAHLHVVLEW